MHRWEPRTRSPRDLVRSPAASPPARILVLAGVNGAGKSSVAGAAIIAQGGVFFNPDEAAREARATVPSLDADAANAYAWALGKSQLERAIQERRPFAFETTLGGQTIPALLQRALDAGLEVHMRYVGLEGVDLHLARVAARVKRGGHDIPVERIRERYISSRVHLLSLMPRLAHLDVYDNSAQADPATGAVPNPVLLFQMNHGAITYACDAVLTPNWAKPLVMAARAYGGVSSP